MRREVAQAEGEQTRKESMSFNPACDCDSCGRRAKHLERARLWEANVSMRQHMYALGKSLNRLSGALAEAEARHHRKCLDTLSGQVWTLASATGTDLCGCNGTCAVCRLDRVRPLVDCIMTTSHRAGELSRRLRNGAKSLTGIGEEAALRDELDRLTAKHDEAMRLLCDRQSGLQPDHPICAGYCPSAPEGGSTAEDYARLAQAEDDRRDALAAVCDHNPVSAVCRTGSTELTKALANLPREGKSFFADCPRDVRGHCKPRGTGDETSRGNDGRQGDEARRGGRPEGGKKSVAARPSEPPHPTDAAAQRHAEANQDRIAAALPGAKAIPGNAPSDVEHEGCNPRPCYRHQLELKTLLTSKRGTVRMTGAAQARKLLRRDDGPPPPVRRQWTVVIDHRDTYRAGALDRAAVFPCYVREGTGSFGVGNMHRVESAGELEELLNTPAGKLPEKAKAPTTGLYATWEAAGPRERKRLAEAAFAREKARIERRQEREHHAAVPE